MPDSFKQRGTLNRPKAKCAQCKKNAKLPNDPDGFCFHCRKVLADRHDQLRKAGK